MTEQIFFFAYINNSFFSKKNVYIYKTHKV